jgi:hypothetical protein
MTATSWLELTKSVGPIIALLVFFIWRDYRREQTMTKRIQDIEDYQKNRLEQLVVESTQAIGENAKSNDRLAQALERRPCLKDQ